MRLRVIASMAALLLAGCKELTENYDQCRCGTEETPTKLSCSSNNLCEGGFELVGKNDLGARGMNSAIAIAGNYAYIGSRTEGVTHQDAGVLIVDISDPTQPTVVGEIGPPDEAVLGLSSRELRAVPDLHLLYVLNSTCSVANTDCSRNLNMFPTTGGIAETENMKIYDITDPVHPTLLSRYDFHNQPDAVPNVPPHEFFLWRDPTEQARVLLYVSRLFGPPDLEVVDATDPRAPTKLATWDLVENGQLDVPRGESESMHSVSVSDDGKIVYVAHFGTGFFMLDSSSIAEKSPTPRLDVLTPLAARIDYSPPYYPGTHSAVKVPGRNLLVLTDEVLPIDQGYTGCPWGWAWLVDVTDPRKPEPFEVVDHATGDVTVYGQMRLPWNDKSLCPPDAQQHRTAYTAHNPTLTPNLAFITWYGAGLQVFDISDVKFPQQVGAFYPEPLPKVATEDPALGGTPRAVWSYPIIRDGLIYIVDIRNGLSIVRYNGPHAEEVSAQPFLEGNSNVR